MDEAHLYSEFVNSLYSAFEELGHHPRVLDQSIHVANGIAAVQPLVAQLQADRFEAVLSFSSFFGSVLLRDGRSLFDALGTKFLGWQVDHPIVAPQSLTRALQNRYAVYSNDNHLRYAQAVSLPGRGTTSRPGRGL